MEKKGHDVLLLSYDDVSNDKPILIVGREVLEKTRTSVQIINAFQDDEAEELYKKLTIQTGRV